MIRALVSALFVLATQPLIAAEVITTELYNDKGLAGHLITTVEDDKNQNVEFKLEWNNRRILITESYQLDERGLPVTVSVEGVSAFGAPVTESYEWVDGHARWQSRSDEGQSRMEENRFYVSVDGADSDIMLRALLRTPGQELDLLPSGRVRLTEIRKATVEKDGNSADVTLYALAGLNLTPTFLWADDTGRLFAQNIGGFLKLMRKGWGLDNFEKLKLLADESENKYYQDLTSKLTHTINSPVLIRNTRVIDVVERKALENHDVLIENEIITRVAKNIEAPANAKIIDGSGQSLIPGLWDMHGHLSKTSAFTYLPAGVTSVRDIGNSPDNMEELEQLYRNELLGTRIYKSGFIDQESEYSAGNGFTVKTLQEAKEAVDWYADRNYLQIKTYSSFDPAWVPEFAQYVHSKGMRLSGHIPAFMSAQQAIDAGFDEIQHINMLLLNFLAGDKLDTRQRLRFSLIGDEAYKMDLASPEMTAFIDDLVEKDIEVDLTVSTFRSLLLTRDRQMDPEYADIADHFPPAFRRGMMTATMNMEDEAMSERYQKSADTLLKMTKLLFDRGVPIIPGTDYFTGFTLLRELELYAMSGIPEIDVLRIATLNSAKVVGQDSKTGSISEGKYADLVLLDGNPLEDITLLRKATLVVQGDRMFQPEAIHAAIGVIPFAKAVVLD
jgi:imidazolonepropionase-like amidohydrolase